MRVTAIVLNWNGADRTASCVQALRSADTVPDSIIVVDNGSTDGSVAELRAQLPSACSLIENRRNLGYAGGMQQGLDHAMQEGADFFWFLNNDTIVDQETLHELLACLARQEERQCMVSPRILGTTGPHQIYFAGRRFNRKTGNFDLCTTAEEHSDLPSQVIQGSCFLVPAEVIREHGFMDTSYFLYMEEYDYSFRLAREGVRCVCALSAVAFHGMDHAEPEADGLGPVRTYYRVRNQIRFWRRWCGPLDRWRLVLAQAMLQARLARIRGFRDPLSQARVKAVWHGLIGKSGCVVRP